jgi:ATP-dependent Lon protease
MTLLYCIRWGKNTDYKVGDIVLHKRNYYICAIDYNSGDASVEEGLKYPYWILINRVNPDFIKNKSNTDTFLNTKSDSEINISSSSKEKKSLKRKLDKQEKAIEDYKKRKTDSEVDDLREKILLLNVNIPTKSFILDKYTTLKTASGSEYTKGMNWINTVLRIPFGKLKNMKVNKRDTPQKIKQYFDAIKQKLDKHIYGLEDVKQEILQYVARKISNPDGKGQILALYGSAGVGKTKLIKSLAEALDMPFFQINFGGLSDSVMLTGHSETYVGSKPGKIVEILQQSKYMNPIIYLDEIDKIGEYKSTDINGILTHLLDEEQNSSFQDNYLSNVGLDLSKVFFVIAFNDISKIDEIVLDRLKVIYIDKPSLEDKINICLDKVIPAILANINFNKNIFIEMNKETMEYFITKKCEREHGIRKIKHNLETILYRLNYDILIDKTENLTVQKGDEKIIYNIGRKYIDKVLKDPVEDDRYLSMYT